MLGNAYEYLIAQFADDAGKKGGEFYTPKRVVRLIVEVNWSAGRLLREYTLLLDPPTYAPPSRDTAQAVQAPSRAAPADSGQIQRPAPTPAPEQRPAPAPRPTPAPARPAPAAEPAPIDEPAPAPVVDDRPFATAVGGDFVVQRGETLWGIATRVRPDSRLTMNQTMLAIFEANPEAFGGNINILRAGAALRIPSADEIFQIKGVQYLGAVGLHPNLVFESNPPPVGQIDPRLDRDHEVLLVDLQDAIHLLQRQHDAALNGNRAPAQAEPGAARRHRHPLALGQPEGAVSEPIDDGAIIWVLKVLDRREGSDQPFEAKLMAVLTSHLLSYREKNEALKVHNDERLYLPPEKRARGRRPARSSRSRTACG